MVKLLHRCSATRRRDRDKGTMLRDKQNKRAAKQAARGATKGAVEQQQNPVKKRWLWPWSRRAEKRWKGKGGANSVQDVAQGDVVVHLSS